MGDPFFPFFILYFFSPDLSIWLIFSGAEVKKVGKVGEMLDYSSQETISEGKIEVLPEQVDVVPTVRTIWGIEE